VVQAEWSRCLPFRTCCSSDVFSRKRPRPDRLTQRWPNLDSGVWPEAPPRGGRWAACCELAAAFLDDLRRIDDQLRDAKKKLDVATRASGTTLTGLFGVGPVAAATVIGDVRDVSRFPGRDHFAATFSRTALVRRPVPLTRQEGTADR